MEVSIHSIEQCGEIRVFELRPPDGAAPLPSYQAGAHLDLTLGNGLVRQYSLCCSAPSGAGYRIAVKREPGSRGGSAWLHESAQVGMALRIGAPRNAFALAPEATMHLLFAGGIGITPILSMAYALLRRGAPFRIAYFARDEASLAFAGELRDGPLATHTVIATALAPSETADRIGAMLALAPQGAHGYACGPAPFMEAVRAQATGRLAPDALHTESFGAMPADAGAGGFVLRLARSGREVMVPAGRSALACLHDAGVAVDCSCEAGVCGSCRIVLLDGLPEHRDCVLTDEERHANGSFLPCVSRARSPVLVLDL